MRISTIAPMLAICAAALTACDQTAITGAVIRGTVVDIHGEPVPGVVVTVVETDKQCLTDALGQYRLAAKTGSATLQFIKTGYTSGALEIADIMPGSVIARPVSLWRLPQTTGLFLFEDYRYRRTGTLIPKPYVTEDGRIVYGIGKLSGIEETLIPKPLLLCYKTPAYDARLCRLGTIKAASPEAPSVKGDVWVATETLPLAMAPVDEPERLLWEVRLMEPMQPGIYALHWGALDGYATTDERIFVFAVAQPSGESSIPAETVAATPAPKTKLPADEPAVDEAATQDSEETAPAAETAVKNQ